MPWMAKDGSARAGALSSGQRFVLVTADAGLRDESSRVRNLRMGEPNRGRTIRERASQQPSKE